ncbi:hypothetical protein FRC12_012067 [Ceratobasidium sp. 428]|nr:hypothetical protein FRC12_012067 [Ceratobasidium sp. 428]
MGSIGMSHAILILLAATGTILVLLSGAFAMMRKRKLRQNPHSDVPNEQLLGISTTCAQGRRDPMEPPKYSSRALGGEYVFTRNAIPLDLEMASMGRPLPPDRAFGSYSPRRLGELPSQPPPAYDPAAPGRF